MCSKLKKDFVLDVLVWWPSFHLLKMENDKN